MQPRVVIKSTITTDAGTMLAQVLLDSSWKIFTGSLKSWNLTAAVAENRWKSIKALEPLISSFVTIKLLLKSSLAQRALLKLVYLFTSECSSLPEIMPKQSCAISTHLTRSSLSEAYVKWDELLVVTSKLQSMSFSGKWASKICCLSVI